MVRFLLEAGAAVDARDNDGKTPLMVAALAGHKEIAEILVAAGADIDAKNSFGWTPLMEAYFEGHAEVVAYLRGLGANLNGFLKNRSNADNWQGVRE